MTTIILRETRTADDQPAVEVAADRQVTTGNYKDLLDAPKYRVIGGALIAPAGAYSMLDLLTDQLALVNGALSLKDVCRAVREIAAEMPGQCDVLVGVGGKVYEVDDSGCAVRAGRGYAAVGSGSGYALGALRYAVARNHDLHAAMLDAVHVAADFDPYTDGSMIDHEIIVQA